MNTIKRTKFNVSLLGETQVGKTSMISVKTGIEFDENQLATVGIDNFLDIAKFENQEYKFIKFLILQGKKDIIVFLPKHLKLLMDIFLFSQSIKDLLLKKLIYG